MDRSREEADRTFALEEGVRYLQQTLTQWARGDIRRRVPTMPVAILEQVGSDLNAFISRFEGSLQADFALRRVQEESARLAEAVQAWRDGRVPIWPQPTGTPLDSVILALASAPQVERGQPTNSRTLGGSEGPYA